MRESVNAWAAWNGVRLEQQRFNNLPVLIDAQQQALGFGVVQEIGRYPGGQLPGLSDGQVFDGCFHRLKLLSVLAGGLRGWVMIRLVRASGG
jgi:hypothetical protein